MEEEKIELPDLSKTIAVLGSFEKENKEFLTTIKTIMNSKPFSYDVRAVDEIITKKIKTPRRRLHLLLSAVKYVIADDSCPSGEILELEYSRHCGTVVAILSRGERSTWMTIDYPLHSNDFNVFSCSNEVSKLEETLSEVDKWANERRDKIEKQMESLEKEAGEQRKAKFKLYFTP